MSKNSITVDQLKIACRHVQELLDAKVTENMAIRTLELFTDVYAKLLTGGSATPHHVTQVPHKQWSTSARNVLSQNPSAAPKDNFRVEHGTPRRAFARKVLNLYESEKLTEESMEGLVNRYWKLAVITLEEDERLNKIARSKAFDTPDDRWRAAGITFD